MAILRGLICCVYASDYPSTDLKGRSIFTVAASALDFSYIAILRTVEAFQLAVSVAVLFAGGLIIFVTSFIYYDRFGA
jgi:hypothetical protein